MAGDFKPKTCRYWALGPQCPDVDANGTTNCRFAHWDAGELASHVDQRGTCVAWRRLGRCDRGDNCWYEHRQTGVSGLYQETIELTGFELAVADAAYQAGFNTFDHKALLDLIWAVKKVRLSPQSENFNRGEFAGYADRREPSVPPVRKQQKQKSLDIIPARRYSPDKQPLNHAIELQFRNLAAQGEKQKQKKQRTTPPIKTEAMDVGPAQIGQKRSIHAVEGDLIDVSVPPPDRSRPASSVQEGLIELMEATDREVTHSTSNVAKRQKNSLDSVQQPLSLPLRTSTAPILSPVSDTMTGTVSELVDAIAAEAAATDNIPSTLGPSPAALAGRLPRKSATKETTGKAEMTKILALVKRKLEETQKNMNNCQVEMQTWFDLHQGSFDDKMVAHLKYLSNSMNKVFDGAEDGAREIDQIVGQIKTGHQKGL